MKLIVDEFFINGGWFLVVLNFVGIENLFEIEISCVDLFGICYYSVFCFVYLFWFVIDGYIEYGWFFYYLVSKWIECFFFLLL